ncbi:hypothetical protein ACEQ8H_003453 [Pleosporales sp. CAS-2024a]
MAIGPRLFRTLLACLELNRFCISGKVSSAEDMTDDASLAQKGSEISAPAAAPSPNANAMFSMPATRKPASSNPPSPGKLVRTIPSRTIKMPVKQSTSQVLSSLRRWLNPQKPGEADFYQPWEKEKICWELAHTAEKIYDEGTWFISILDAEILKNAEKSRHLKFRERIDMLIQLF